LNKETDSGSYIFGGSLPIDPNSSEARKKRHMQRLDDIVATSMFGNLFGFDAAKIIFTIISVISTISRIISFIWNIINLIIILMIIKIILTIIEAGLTGSHGLLEGIRGILQKLHDFNINIPLSKIKVPDIPVNINIPDVNLGKISLSKANIPEINIPGVNIPGVNIPGAKIPDVETPSIGIPGFKIGPVNVPGVNTPGIKIPGVNIPGKNIPGVNIPGKNIPGTNIPDFQMPTLPGFKYNKTFTTPTIPDINTNLFKPILGDPINKISQANNQIPNTSGEVIEIIAKSMFNNIVPFMINMVDVGKSIVK
jgi:hypothetical protein